MRTAPETKWREIEDKDVIVKWEDAGRTEEGFFCGGKPAGTKQSLLYAFKRTDETLWKTWGTYVLDQKLAKIQEGDYCQIVFDGYDAKGKTKLFSVRVAERDEDE